MKNIKSKYKNTLKEHRMKLQLTLNEVAQQLISVRDENRIAKWEAGESAPSTPNLFRLCRIYGIAPEDAYPELFNQARCK